jgi:hypothetical protein
MLNSSEKFALILIPPFLVGLTNFYDKGLTNFYDRKIRVWLIFMIVRVWLIFMIERVCKESNQWP